MSEIQSVEGRPIKKGLSPARRSAVGALALLGVAIVVFVVGTIFRPAEIPADHVLALIRTDGSAALAKVDGSAAAEIGGAGVATGDASIRWAPGGDFVAMRTSGEVIVVDRFGIVAWRRPIRLPSAAIAWSPDGRRLAVYDATPADATSATDVTLDVFTTAGELEWRAPIDEGFGIVTGYDSLAWSPESDAIAFVGFTERVVDARQPTALWLADLPGQTIRQVTDEDAFDYGPAWSADAGLLMARISTLESGIGRVDLASGDLSLLLRTGAELCPVHSTCAPANLDPLVPSPDGRLVAFREPTFGLSILDIASGAVGKVQEPGTLTVAPWAWSDGGAALLYARHAGREPDPAVPPDLVRFELETGARSVVVSDVQAFDLLASVPSN